VLFRSHKLFNVRINVDGSEKNITTHEKKVGEVLAEAGVKLSVDDKLIGAMSSDILSSDLVLTVKRVSYKYISLEETISAGTVYKDSNSIAAGKTNVLNSGSDGRKKLEYRIVYEDGNQVDKQLVKETVISAAIDRVVERGVVGSLKLKNGYELKYIRTIDVKCTAYTASFEDTGKKSGDPGYGVTKSGLRAQEGVVAVDPKIIPLGTKMYISILDDSMEDYGYCVAGDTGSKVKGNRVDLYFDAARDTLLKFGVRSARVYILE
jgi:3D (Asp-Asp-Asp) domain-containing protein